MTLNELIDELRCSYALCQLSKRGWGSYLIRLADQAMSEGFYCELFRTLLFDGVDLNSTRFLTPIESAMKEFDPSATPPVCKECHHLYIQTRMRALLAENADAIDIACDLIIVENYNSPFDSFDYKFPDLEKLIGVYYEWWAGYSEWMYGEEREIQRLKSISELQAAARDWLSNHHSNN